ncbi:MAG TPA: response regulator [Thermoanaerobaculia bacterium]|nr:response regulator [Thermoanaerobaculia bacterium]
MGHEDRRLRALVVDDEEEDRLRIAEILKREGFSVLEARNGREALDRIRGGDEFGIIVLDILMPYVDGFEVMSHLKKKNPDVLARTVVASRLDLKDLSTFFPSCRVIQKPVNMSELSSIARQVGARGARND